MAVCMLCVVSHKLPPPPPHDDEGSVKSGEGGTGEIIACARKCVQQLPNLPAAHNALGLAAEAAAAVQGSTTCDSGHLREAVEAYETALALMLPPSGASDPATGRGSGQAAGSWYLGVGPGSSNMALHDGGAGAGEGTGVQTLAVRLNLARTLAKLGQGGGGEEGTALLSAAGGLGACRRAVAMYQQLEREGAMQADAAAWLAYAGVGWLLSGFCKTNLNIV